VLAETARLVASLEMRDSGFSKVADNAGKKLSGLERSVARIGAIGRQGLSNLGRNLSRIGIGLAGIATVGVVASIKSGTDELIELENVTASVSKSIRVMGLQGKLTAGQINQWANEIESSVDAAFDDKDIYAASTALLRFGNVGKKGLRDMLVVATDLAAGLGTDVQGAAVQLAKAMANPAKASRLLLKIGEDLTDGQTKRITKLIEEGKLHKAQAVLLEIVGKKTKGLADGLNGKTADAMNNWNDALSEVNKAIAGSFLPLMTEAANFLSAELLKPTTIATIKRLGQDLAGIGRSAFEFLKKVPWSEIGDGLGKAAGFVGQLFDAFRSMPPEVQATLIAIAGLNKLSGGAISGIVGELGKGLIKGVLGMTAGVVHVKAATATIGGGAIPAGGGGGGKGGGGGTNVFGAGKLATIAQMISKVIVVGIVAELAGIVEPALNDLASSLKKGLKVDDFWKSIGIGPLSPDDLQWPFGPKNTPTIFPELGGNGLLGGTPKGTETVPLGGPKIMGTLTREQQATTDKVETVATNTAGTKEQVIVSGKAARAGLSEVARAATTAGVLASFAAINAGSRVAAAIAAKDMSVTTNTHVTVNVTAANVTKEVVIQERWGNGNGSAGGGNGANRLNPGIA
jgi:hypothetical protein